jgi:hypothetical protein
MQMLHHCYRALQMLSFGISHNPMRATQVTKKNKMAATLTVSKSVFLHFRPFRILILVQKLHSKYQIYYLNRYMPSHKVDVEETIAVTNYYNKNFIYTNTYIT